MPIVVVQSFTIAPTSTVVPRRHTTQLWDQQQQQQPWQGEVVPGTTIRGCTLQNIDTTTWKLQIDGAEADLGRFSQAIYQKITREAKQERFQGFRPGTIPPHLEPTYRLFTMDECARETVLEALQQNEVRPFESCRSDMELSDFCIPPAALPKKRKKKKKRSQKQSASTNEEKDDNSESVEAEEPPAWRTFATIKEAVDAGWRPGQSFSFCASDVKGQKVQPGAPGAKPLGTKY